MRITINLTDKDQYPQKVLNAPIFDPAIGQLSCHLRCCVKDPLFSGVDQCGTRPGSAKTGPIAPANSSLFSRFSLYRSRRVAGAAVGFSMAEQRPAGKKTALQQRLALSNAAASWLEKPHCSALVQVSTCAAGITASQQTIQAS